MIELNGVSAGYGDGRVLRDLSVCFPGGSLTFIVGPNGCGKTTLLKTLAGLIPASGGTVRLKGRGIASYSAEERARLVAYLPQSRPVPDMTVRMMIRHGRFAHMGFVKKLSAEDERQIERAVEMTSISGLLDKKLGSVSGGERQLAYLTMAIAQDAEILLLDEPDVYLDIPHQAELMKIIGRLHESGRTIVVAAHNLPMAFTYAERVDMMRAGELVLTGTPAEAADSPLFHDLFGFNMRTSPEGALYRYVIQNDVDTRQVVWHRN